MISIMASFVSGAGSLAGISTIASDMMQAVGNNIGRDAGFILLAVTQSLGLL